ncbi:MAG: homoserine kinase [Caulobacteraceae bacterium]
MAVYTDITDAELADFLGAFDLGPAISFKGIAEGVENSNFLVETAAGRFILTVYERRARAEDLPFFLGLMAALAEQGFPSATPVADRHGRCIASLRGKPAALIGFLPGVAPRQPSVAACREAGEGLAWLHRAGEGLDSRLGRRLNDLGQRHWRPLFAPLAGAADGLRAGLAPLVTADLDLFERTWPNDLPAGIVHADFFPDNVFFLGERFAGAIDFYFAAWDLLAYDLAIALNAWCFDADGEANSSAAAALIDGYQRRRRLTDPEYAALPLLAHGAAMRFFLTRLKDWGATPPGALVRPKDPLEYARKLAFHRDGGFRLVVRPISDGTAITPDGRTTRC